MKPTSCRPDVAFRVARRGSTTMSSGCAGSSPTATTSTGSKIEIKAESPDLVIAAPPICRRGSSRSIPTSAIKRSTANKWSRHVRLHPPRCGRAPPADQGDLSRLRRCRPVLPAHHQSDLSAARQAQVAACPRIPFKGWHFGWGLRLSAGRAAAAQGPHARPARGMNARALRAALGALVVAVGIGRGRLAALHSRHGPRATTESG